MSHSSIGLLCNAVIPIFTGSFATLSLPPDAKRKLKKAGLYTDKDEDDEDDTMLERVTAQEAYLFPIIGSATLLSLYLAFKYLDQALINKIIGGYVRIMGVFALTNAISTINKRLLSFLRTAYLRATSFTIAASIVAYQYFVKSHWFLENLSGLALSFTAIKYLMLDSFRTGTILLTGLFFYDIWWVFGTDVMVSVATNFDAPIKLTFPRDLNDPSLGLSMLGLGDIVVPGIFLSLALRFDYNLALNRSKLPFEPSSPFPKPYFAITLGFYIIGLITTMCVMHVFQAAQPALLYLSPACIFSLYGTAYIRGELNEVLEFKENWEEEEEGKEGIKQK